MAEQPNQLTNTNQTDKSSLFASLNFFMSQMKMDTDGMLPAKVISFDRVKNVAEVQPVIHFMTLDNKEQPRQSVTEINVLSLGGGGFHISFPLKPGDLGWIFAADRDLTQFKKELAEGAPSHGQAKRFASGLFIPDVFRQYSIAESDSSAMVIQSTDGSVSIALHEDSISMKAPTMVRIETATAEINAHLIINGETTFNGPVDAMPAATVNLPASTTVNGINVAGHGHEQNGDSGRTSGGMEA